MSRGGKNQRRGNRATTARKWQLLVPVTRIVPAKLQEAADNDPALQARLDLEGHEMWANDYYTVHVTRNEDGIVTDLGIRRNDRKPVRDWRHLQWIKNQLAGKETEAIELFPAESRLVDTANHYWLWVFPPGMKIPLGFNEGRIVKTAAEAAVTGARQRDPEGDGTDGS